MSVLRIPADYDDAFSHMLGFGLASILEDAVEDRICRLWWSGRHTLMVETNDEITEMECAHIVRAHAERWHKSQWLNARGSYNGKEKTVATLSPHIGKVIGREGWRTLEDDRSRAIDALQTALDERYIGALGEPSYWSLKRTKSFSNIGPEDIMQDDGASLWEMTYRVGGREFVTDRLRKLANILSKRSYEEVHSGLFGQTVVDELHDEKKGKDDSGASLTPTGLRVRSYTDNAQAWCALFGFSLFPLYKSVHHEASPTAGFVRQQNSERRFWQVVLPLVETPWTLAKYRSVIRSWALVCAVDCIDIWHDNSSWDDNLLLQEDTDIHAWLRQQGLRYCMLFTRFEVKPQNTTEYWLLRGQLVRL